MNYKNYEKVTYRVLRLVIVNKIFWLKSICIYIGA